MARPIRDVGCAGRRESVAGAQRLSSIDECARSSCPSLKRRRGFVCYYWLDTGKGEGASVSVFRDKAGADESVHLAADYVKEHLSKFIIQKPEIIDGPIKAHD